MPAIEATSGVNLGSESFLVLFFKKELLPSFLEAPTMKRWPVQDAKARFSEMLETCLTDGPQMVNRRGEEAAVLVPAGEWRHIEAGATDAGIRMIAGVRARHQCRVRTAPAAAAWWRSCQAEFCTGALGASVLNPFVLSADT
jgi:prevent-host-death family protein